MDEQQIQAKIEEAKAAGYTDAEIQSHLNDLRGTPTPLEAPEKNKHHEANVGTAQMAALAGAEKIGDLAIDAAKYGIPAYGVYKGGQAIANRIPGPVPPTMPTAPTPAGGFDPGGQKVADFMRGGAPNGAPIGPGQATAPIAPEAAASSPQAQAYQAQQAARQAAVQPPTAQNYIQRMAQLAGRYAPMARGAAGVTAAVMPGNVGQNYPFPQSGPMRGMEINPQTGRPWTEMELARYNQQQ